MGMISNDAGQSDTRGRRRMSGAKGRARIVKNQSLCSSVD